MSWPSYIKYHGLALPPGAHSEESLEYAQNFAVEDTDVFTVTYPKSGTIWMQELLPLVLSGGDLTPIQTIPNWDRVPWLEEKRLKVVVDQLSSPRALVTHFPYQLMPQSFVYSKAKVIYVMRNPKDVIVSSYYFHQMATFLEDPGTWDEFMDKFLEGRGFSLKKFLSLCGLAVTPCLVVMVGKAVVPLRIVMFGKWTDHVKSWRHTELGDRIMYITYEQMIQDLPSAVRLISDFLGKNLSDKIIEKIAYHCSFKSMQANIMSNFSLVPKIYMDSDKSQFLRKGVVGDWRKHFSSEQLVHFSSVIYKELEGERFTLPWSLDGATDVANVLAQV
ncbi:sulfotransferase family 2, cytosolic sulfotransferase 3 isoform X2 [Phyllopteryx taeniolatus]|uniref:sulfotransferase family 2, cytosolic sulfotransferase 3 isoform X2 n=1 Tax=Phyllopteryx taeniolatus TaxID=161469 RepID=UPI002AD55EB1|nr:sulfotransferase family 2, cytosolic sulfotransferase 3 isoform X2 [Phyllopteryx taeniolatus]